MAHTANGGGETPWRWQSAMEASKKRLVEKGFPMPARPLITKEADYSFYPDNVEDVTAIKLANLTLRLRSWYAYAAVELAFVEAENVAFLEVYEVLLGEKMQDIAEGLKKDDNVRATKEVLKAMAIQRDGALKEAHKAKISLELRVRHMKGTVQGLQIKIQGLDNEAFRRMAAAKIELGGKQ